jgi:hypothetical protein
VPAEQRLRRHDHPLPASRREEPSKRREESAIGWLQRPRLLPMEHRHLMPQNNQLDVLGELVAPASDEQPQHRGEHEVNEGNEHPPMLPEPPPRTSTVETSFETPQGCSFRSFVHSASRFSAAVAACTGRPRGGLVCERGHLDLGMRPRDRNVRFLSLGVAATG